MIHVRVAKLLIVFVFLSSTTFVQSKGRFEPLLEIGNITNETHHKMADEIKIVSYNMRWRGGDDLKKLIELFKTDKEIGGASIIGLQEVDRNKKRTRNENTVKTIAHSLKMNYAWAAPPNAKGKEREEEETGVAILSKFPISDVTRIVLPNEGPGGRHRAAIGATVKMGKLKVRVYSVHAETRISTEKKIEQLKASINDLNDNHRDINHAIILGDFNTILDDVDKTTILFQDSGFNTPFSTKETTWRQFFIKLKLDWLWLRGIKAKDYGIDKKITLSDHYPLWVNVDFSEAQTQTTSKPTNEKLREELLKMANEDQDARKDLKGENLSNQKLIETMNNLDLKNIARLKEIVASNKGFPTAEQVGKDGVGAALLILQHSPDWDFQKEMLPAVEAATKRGDVHPHNYTTLVDRVRVHFGQKQLYGTQASIKDGKLVVDPIEDEERVDERRKALGLSPLDEYLKDLADMYKLPVERKPKL